ncbi:MAG TPA: exopolysaccharide biosynthesis polyprenyl glycosylphosphotransferase, partial [Naasia sp.]
MAWALAGAHLISFGLGASQLEVSGAQGPGISYLVVSLLLGVAWIAVLALVGSRDHRVVGTGPSEYRRVVRASLSLFGTVAVAAYLLKTDVARGYLITALPLGLAVLMLSRWMWRQWLTERRKRGENVYRVLLLGTRLNVVHLARELLRNPEAGYGVVGAVIPGDGAPLLVGGVHIPVSPHLDDVLSEMDRLGADTVAVTGTDRLPPDKLRELSWSLEPGQRHLVLVPSLTDIAGPRLHTRPVAGLPLIHVETPRYEGPKLYGKRAFDLVAAGLLLVLLSPLLLGAAAAIKVADRGPVLFRQRRVGRNGADFDMLKFRSMVVDAEAKLAALRRPEDEVGNPVLFKMKADPRVTRIGRVLRRFSIDELPQLLNVLRGDMSLVGPRPPLAA